MTEKSEKPTSGGELQALGFPFDVMAMAGELTKICTDMSADTLEICKLPDD